MPDSDYHEARRIDEANTNQLRVPTEIFPHPFALVTEANFMNVGDSQAWGEQDDGNVRSETPLLS